MTPATASTAELLTTAEMALQLGVSLRYLRRVRLHLFTEGEHYILRRAGLSPRGEIRWIPAATLARAEQLRSGTPSTPATEQG